MILRRRLWKGSKRFLGGGTKKASDEIEELVLTWIIEQRRKNVHLSRKMIHVEAKTIFDTEIVEALKRKETFTSSANQNIKQCSNQSINPEMFIWWHFVTKFHKNMNPLADTGICDGRNTGL